MADTAEQLVVSLEARVNQFERSFRQASRIANDNWRSIEQRGEQGAKKLESTFAQATQGVSKQFQLMATTAAGALTAALGVSELRKYADEWTAARSKIAAAGEELANVAARQSQLTDLAIASRSNLGAVVDLYSGLTRSTKEMGASQAQVLRVTELISKAFATSGASAEEAKGAILQLNQALAAGALRGDELNSVMEGAPALARLIAQEFGVSIGELKSLGEQGKLSADRVFSAILNGGAQIESEFAKTTATIGQSIQALETAFTRWVGQVDQASGASTALASGLASVAANMNVVAPLAATFAASFAGFYVGGPISAGIAGAATALAGFGNQIHPIAGDLASLGDYARAAFDLIKTQGAEAAAWFQSQFAKAAQSVSAALASIDAGDALAHLLSGVKTVANLTIGSFVAAGHAIVAAWDATGVGIVNTIVAAMNSVIATVEAAANKVAAAVNGITKATNEGVGTAFPEIKPVDLGRIQGSYRSAGEIAAKGFNDGLAALKHDYLSDIDASLNRLRDSANKAAIERTFNQKSTDPGANDGDIDAALKSSPAKASGGKGGAKAKGRASQAEDEFSREIADIERRTRSLDMEREAVGKETREVEKSKVAYGLLEAAKKANIPVTDELKGKVEQLADTYANAKVRLDEAKEHQEQFKSAASEVASTLSEGFKSAVMNGEKLSAVLEKLWQRLADKLIDKAFSSVVDGIFNVGDKKQSGGFDFLGGLFGKLLGGLHLADGGAVQGPGGPRADMIPAMLSAGEFVVNADAAARFMPLLSAINSGRLGVPRFADGGLVAAPSVASLARSNGSPASGAPAQAAAPEITVHNYAAGIEVKPQLDQGQVSLMIYSALKENNAKMPSILSSADKRSP